LTGTHEHFDALETRDPAARERELFAALPAHLEHAKARAPGLARILADVDPRAVTSRTALARLPVTRKSDLAELQAGAMPFGGLTAVPTGELARVFVSPGPLYDPEGREPDYWRMARALHAAGFRKGDLVHNTFSYHLTPAGSMLESGARALGCAVIPAGGGQTEQQVAVMAALRPNGYTGTPSFLRILLEKAAELRQDVSSIKKALVSAEALPPSLRKAIADLGVDALQCYASADLGLIAYESVAKEGMIVDEGVIVEIVRPGTGDPVPEGEVGEIVVTTFNRTYPLIRFGTGDLSAVLAGASPCGRTNMRIKGWMGRADQRTKVRGMFVTPQQIAEVVRRHAEIKRARLVVTSVDNRDAMTLRCEAAGGGDALVQSVVSTLHTVTQLRGEVALVAVGSLPNDGKVIEDARTYA
jgi:phenylacetate-CoA ligase